MSYFTYVAGVYVGLSLRNIDSDKYRVHRMVQSARNLRTDLVNSVRTVVFKKPPMPDNVIESSSSGGFTKWFGTNFDYLTKAWLIEGLYKSDVFTGGAAGGSQGVESGGFEEVEEPKN